ncbi:hypothetical protein BJ742DRAFT_739528 [Cladochytrium replicatum]|nr:hypothetical protein BJ742DRAFT_739528 [Cladochytrium replicatum]
MEKFMTSVRAREVWRGMGSRISAIRLIFQFRFDCATCQTIPWEGKVSPFAHLWADSIRRNDPAMIQAYLVHDRVNGATKSLGRKTTRWLKYVDLESLGLIYGSRGFRGYSAHELQPIHTKFPTLGTVA